MENNTVIFREVIYLDTNLWKKIKYEIMAKNDGKRLNNMDITSYPLYERKPNGQVVPNELISRKSNPILYFDVTTAPEMIKRDLEIKYGVNIIELPVTKRKVRNYCALLPVFSKSYSGITPEGKAADISETLTLEEKSEIGRDFVLVENKDNGLKISSCIISPRGEHIPDNVYLRVDFSTINRTIEDKIMNDLIHVVINKNGLYSVIDVSEETKKYNTVFR